MLFLCCSGLTYFYPPKLGGWTTFYLGGGTSCLTPVDAPLAGGFFWNRLDLPGDLGGTAWSSLLFPLLLLPLEDAKDLAASWV